MFIDFNNLKYLQVKNKDIQQGKKKRFYLFRNVKSGQMVG